MGPLAAALAATVLLLAPASAAAADWLTFGFDSARTNENPFETGIGVTNARFLREVWAAPLEGVANAQPLVVANVALPGGRRAELVVAATERGVVTAHDAVTGARLWRRALGARRTRCTDLPDGVYGISSTPVIDRRAGLLYAVSGDGRAHALHLSTGRERRGWPVAITRAPAREYVWGALALRAGRLYAATASHCSNAFYRGRLVSLDTRRARVTHTWFPLAPRHRGGGMWGWGGVALDRRNGDVFVATADAIGSPAHARGADSVARLSRDLRLRALNRPPTANVQDSEFGGAPMLVQAPGCPAQLVVTHKSGALFLYDRDRLAAGPRQTERMGRPDFLGTYGTYAWSAQARMLFVMNNSTGLFPHGLLAWRLDDRCFLVPSWSYGAGPDPALYSPPVVANGVVYFTTGFGRYLVAVDAETGESLWRSPPLERPAYGGPTIANGRLYLAAWDQRLHAYAPAR
jgi:outer membrane protein assembly factor BamB